MTVPSGRIVERLDVFCDRLAGNQAVLVDLFLDVLLLQTAEEARMSFNSRALSADR
jgi:hypothetical protein